MKRRKVLKGIAASSVLATGVASASSTPGVKTGSVEQYDRLRVVSDGQTLRTIEAPTWEDVKEVQSTLDDGQRLVTPDDDCVAFCEANCPCKPCLVGCFNCCNIEEEICDCCSQVDDPDEVECCEGC